MIIQIQTVMVGLEHDTAGVVLIISANLFPSPGGCPGGVWVEVGPWRCFSTSQEGNAAVGFPRLWKPDLHYDLCHPLYVFVVFLILDAQNSPSHFTAIETKV